MWWLIGAVACAVAVLIAVFVVINWQTIREMYREVQAERTRSLFGMQREHLEAHFLQQAALSGKPRGLRWKDCEFDNYVCFARDRMTGQFLALVGVTIQFEPAEGADSEDWPSIEHRRSGTAVFHFEKGRWHTQGRALFNMSPDEALDHFREQYERVELL
ncbi:MAG: hypothetical protein C4297_01380 [Gemmataceae bacterium]